MKQWYIDSAKIGDVIISSRVRLARNLVKYKFAGRISDAEATAMVGELRGLTSLLKERENIEFYSCNVNQLGEIERTSMVEWHIVSPLLSEKKQDTGLILAEDENISILLNEEDHIRIQAVASHMNMQAVMQAADRIDDLIEEEFEYAYHKQYGYLTACPTNAGTGLRASYMLFLPALTICGKMELLAREVAKYGVTIRGIYGEGTKSYGYLYQVSNQKTLGSKESEIIEILDQIVGQIVRQERMQRIAMLNDNTPDLEDKVYRSYAILRYAKRLTSQDAMTLLAQLKFGVDTGLIKLSNVEQESSPARKQEKSSTEEEIKQPIGEKLKEVQPNLHLLMMEIQPATIQKMLGKSTGAEECNRFRAEYMNQRLPELECRP